MKIGGIGIVSACGRGVDSFEDALKKGWRKPSELNIPGGNYPKRFVYQVEPETMEDKCLLKKIRRADKFSKMAVLAAADALDNCNCEQINKHRLGVIVSLAFGPHVTTFDFLDGLLDYGDANVSPIKFSNSVQNAAASYITEILGIHGPCLTITRFHFSFQYALLMAKLWIEEKRCDYCLVGAVDQYGQVMDYIQNCKLSPAPDGKIKPFNFKPTWQVPGEGAGFFLVGNDFERAFCEVESVNFNEKSDIKADLNILDTDGTLADETAYLSGLSPDVPTAAYSPLFGSMPIGSAFNCVAGVLILKNQIYYPNPITDNPHGIGLIQKHKNSNIELISCTRYNCNTENSIIHLKRV